MDKTPARFKAALLVLLAGLALPVAARAAPLRAALFPVELDDTSLQGITATEPPQELARLRRLDAELRTALVESGRYTLVDTGKLAPQIAAETLRTCNACVEALARQAGAAVAVNGWVQKVSNLILNINLVVRDATTGRMLRAGSVDIRGDTDESWTRGISFIIRNYKLGGPSAQ